MLTNFPSNLFSNDDRTASDHLPVLMAFHNPFDTPFKLLAITCTNHCVTLKWESQDKRSFTLESSSNLAAWLRFATNLLATNTDASFAFTTSNVTEPVKFFRVFRVP